MGKKMADNNTENQDGERGLGKAFLAGVGGIASYVAYKKISKKTKKHVKTKDGKTREIDCDVLVDESGNELPGQEFDESGRCINEDEVVAKVNNNQKSSDNSGEPSYVQGIGATKV